MKLKVVHVDPFSNVLADKNSGIPMSDDFTDINAKRGEELTKQRDFCHMVLKVIGRELKRAKHSQHF